VVRVVEQQGEAPAEAPRAADGGDQRGSFHSCTMTRSAPSSAASASSPVATACARSSG
jgi:hypothetical protein